MGNAQGDYVISCNVNLSTCITPVPGKDYYLLTKTTKGKSPGATAWLQGWSGAYNNHENIALLPVEGERAQIKMYWLNSWEDKKQKL